MNVLCSVLDRVSFIMDVVQELLIFHSKNMLFNEKYSFLMKK